MIFCSEAISHPYPQLGKNCWQEPKDWWLSRAGNTQQPWVASTTQEPWQSTVNTGGGVSPTSLHVQGASRLSSAAHRSRTPEAHTRCVPHTPHLQSCYQFCVLSSCTNNDTPLLCSGSQAPSPNACSWTLSARRLGIGTLQEPPPPSGPGFICQAALTDQSWCPRAVSQHTVDSVGSWGS